MRISALVFVAAIFVFVNGQVPVPAPVPVPVPAPLGLPVPFVPPFFGGLFPRFLFPGLGFPFGPFGFGLGLGRFGLLGGLGRFRFGKRSVDTFPEQWLNGNRTICRFEQARSVIRCDGEQDFECAVEARLDEIKGITVRLPNLNMVQDVIRAQGKEVPCVRVLSRVTGTSTLVNPRTSKDVVLSVYSSPSVSEQGWLVRDEQCYRRIEGLVTRLGIENLRFAIDRE